MFFPLYLRRKYLLLVFEKILEYCPELQIWRILQSFKFLSVAQLINQLKELFFPV